MNSNSKEYEGYFVEYFGDIKKYLDNLDYAILYEELPLYYFILIEAGRLKDFINAVPGIVSIEPNYVYILSPIEKEDFISENKYNTLKTPYSGRRVNLGIIGSGIDYLDEAFISKDGHSRIKAIWDQTIGKVYEKLQIDEELALKGNKNEGSSIKHNDLSGYTTHLCKAISGENSPTNQCEFVIVKLKEADRAVVRNNCVDSYKENLYETYHIVKALQYLSEFNRASREPMVVYIPLESNFGGRNGTSVLEKFIDYFSSINKDLFFITTNGSEGDGYTHNEGRINEKSFYENIPIIVWGENDLKESGRSFIISFWSNIHDKISFTLKDPLDNVIYREELSNKLDVKSYKSISGNIEVISIPSKAKSMQHETIIKIKGGASGIWSIVLDGNEIVYGNYDIWLSMKELTNYSVTFKYPRKNKTLTNPATAKSILSCMSYSKQEQGIRILSGKDDILYTFSLKSSIIINDSRFLIEDDFGTIKVNGIGISGCILAIALIMILQWAIVEENKLDLRLSDIKTLLLKASTNNITNNYPVLDINKLNNLLLNK